MSTYLEQSKIVDLLRMVDQNLYKYLLDFTVCSTKHRSTTSKNHPRYITDTASAALNSVEIAAGTPRLTFINPQVTGRILVPKLKVRHLHRTKKQKLSTRYIHRIFMTVPPAKIQLIKL